MKRKMIRVKLRDKNRALWVREQTRGNDILVEMKTKKCALAGHVMRKQDGRWSLSVTEWIPKEGSHSRGQHKVKWTDEIKKFAGLTWPRSAQDRDNWKNIVEAFALDCA